MRWLVSENFCDNNTHLCIMHNNYNNQSMYFMLKLMSLKCTQTCDCSYCCWGTAWVTVARWAIFYTNHLWPFLLSNRSIPNSIKSWSWNWKLNIQPSWGPAGVSLSKIQEYVLKYVRSTSRCLPWWIPCLIKRSRSLGGHKAVVIIMVFSLVISLSSHAV